jgi:Fur family ferric uptake transcriptional regulator
MMGPDLHRVVAERLRAVDQRYTASRRALVELLAGAGRPLSVGDIRARQAAVPQSSAYRNMAVLEQAGVVRRVQAADEFSRFELAEDLTEHHHHLVCVECGSVSDFTVPARVERTVEKALAEAAAGAGFRPETHRLDLVGRCAACA